MVVNFCTQVTVLLVYDTADPITFLIEKYCTRLFVVVAVFVIRGRKIYEPPRFMTVEQAVMQLREAVTTRTEEEKQDDSPSNE